MTRSLVLALFLIPAAFAAAPPALIDPIRVAALVELLDDDAFDARQAADRELRRIGKPLLPLLRQEQARATSHEVRDRLTRIVRDLTADDALPHLLRLLTHKDARYRDHAHHALGKLTPDHLPALEAALQRGQEAEGRAVLEKLITEMKR